MVHGDLGEEVEMNTGVPQGSPLSPLLYAKYIDGLHDALRKEGLGVWIAGRLVPLLLFADDIVLFASSPGDLQRSLRVLDVYAQRWRFSTNHSKSKLLRYGAPAQSFCR